MQDQIFNLKHCLSQLDEQAMPGIARSDPVVILTVGTSLLENITEFLAQDEREPRSRERRKLRAGQILEKYLDSRDAKEIDQMSSFLLGNFTVPCWGRVTQHVVLDRNYRYPCAEIQSFILLLASSRFQDEEAKINSLRTILFHSQPPTGRGDGWLCAQAVAKLLRTIQPATFLDRWNFQLSTELRAYRVDESQDALTLAIQRGVEELWESLRRTIDDIQDTTSGQSHIYLDLTGGYKVLIPYTALFSYLEHGVTSFYCYEKDRISVSFLPALPLNWDLSFLDEFRTLVRGAPPPSQLKVFPEKIQALFTSALGEGTENRVGVVGRAIMDAYEQHRSRRFGYGLALIERLPGEWQQSILELVKVWENAWLGDQIPETVEHTRNHSQRLLELTYFFLKYSQLFLDRKKLPDYALYVLIAAIWLHDIGHAELSINLPLSPWPQNDSNFKKERDFSLMQFPTLVRDWHSYSSYRRICRQAYWKDSDVSELVAILAWYHRGAQPLFQDSCNSNIVLAVDHSNLFQEVGSEGKIIHPYITFPSLEVRLNQFAEKIGLKGEARGEFVRVMLLCEGILRLMDSCDVQEDRLSDEAFRKTRQCRSEEETAFLRKRLSRHQELWGLLNKNMLEQLDEVKTILLGIESGDPSCSPRKVKKTIARLLSDYLQANSHGSDPMEEELYLEALSLMNRIAFKMEQPGHFRKHESILLSYLHWQKADNGFAIVLVPSSESIDTGMPKDLKDAAEEIWEEYKAVERIFTAADCPCTGIYTIQSDHERRDEPLRKLYPEPEREVSMEGGSMCA